MGSGHDHYISHTVRCLAVVPQAEHHITGTGADALAAKLGHDNLHEGMRVSDADARAAIAAAERQAAKVVAFLLQ